MLTWKRNRSAFTLIELLVVVIIVAVLAAVGVPLLSANVNRARQSEADAGLGTLRTGMRARLAEFNSYAGAALPTATTDGNLGATWSDLCGRFFSANNYSILGTPDATTFCIQVTAGGTNGTCPANAAAEDKVPSAFARSIDEAGNLQTGTCSGAVIN